MTQAASFPHYTAVELVLDRMLHALAVLVAAGGVAWLFAYAAHTGDIRQIIGLGIYGAALIGMFAASAAYNSYDPCRTKELLRRVDHAMIFAMIAGTARRSLCPPFPQASGC